MNNSGPLKKLGWTFLLIGGATAAATYTPFDFGDPSGLYAYAALFTVMATFCFTAAWKNKSYVNY